MGCRHLFSSSVMLFRSVPYVKLYTNPKFLTLMPFLRKERIPYKQCTEELLMMKDRKLAEIKELCADGNKEFTDNLTDQKEYLNMILYQLYTRGDEKNLLMVFDEINANGVLSETSYTILMRYYADCKNLNKVLDLFNLMRNNPNTLLGTRCYLPLIVSLLNFKQFDSASAYLTEMLEAMKKSYNEKLFAEIIISCTELREEHSKHVEKFVTQIFDYMNSYGIEKVHSDTVSAIKKWFESDKKNKWFLKPTTINRKNRKCQCCQQQLEPVNLTPERLLKLKRNLMAVVEECLNHVETPYNKKRIFQSSPLTEELINKIKSRVHRKATHDDFMHILGLKVESNSQMEKSLITKNFIDNKSDNCSDTLTKLKTFLENNPPFEVIIDSLNMGYHAQQGFEINKVQAVVQYFLDKKKKILLVCADSMKPSYLTPAKTVEKPSTIRFRKIMEYLDENCTLYFSESSLVDDYCLLYTIAYHNFELKIVSSDLFRNHLQLMDADTRTAFKRWQLANQMRPLRFLSDDSPIFQPLANYNVTIQKNGSNWHVPISNSVFKEKKERSSWLCFQQKNEIDS